MIDSLVTISGPGVDMFSELSAPDFDLRADRNNRNDPLPEQSSADWQRGAMPTFRLEPPDIKLYSVHGTPVLRSDHSVRDIIDHLTQVLSKFGETWLQPMGDFGLKGSPRKEPDYGALIAEVLKAKQFLEHAARERSDGLPPSILVRSIASEAAPLLEHFLIDIVGEHRASGPHSGETSGILHTLTDIKHDLRKLLENFDLQSVQIAAQSGMFGALEEKLSAGSGSAAADDESSGEE